MVMSLLLLYSMGASAAPATTRSAAPDPPVRVWFNSDGNYQYGDRAKVYAKAAEDGNLVVLRADASGQVRVLFRSEEHTSELQSQSNLVCRLLLEKKKTQTTVTSYLGISSRTPSTPPCHDTCLIV